MLPSCFRELRADLSGADLYAADLAAAALTQAALTQADLSGTNMRGAKNLTTDQVQTAKNWHEAHLPDYLKDLPESPAR